MNDVKDKTLSVMVNLPVDRLHPHDSAKEMCVSTSYRSDFPSEMELLNGEYESYQRKEESAG